MTSSLLNIGLSGLNSAQLAITTTGNNIANTATPGYSRELLVLSEANGIATGAGFIGGGVNTTTIQRQYSQTLNNELNNAQSQSASLTSYGTLIAQLNNLVGDPSAGISSAMSAFFSGLHDVANSANTSATRSTALSNGNTLASLLNQAGQQFDQLRQNVNTTVSSTVSQVNDITKQIAQLNVQIAAATSTGQPPNQLLDARDAAVSQLGQLVGVSSIQQSNGSVTIVLANGEPLVSGSQSYQLTAVKSPSDPTELVVGYQQQDSTNPSNTITSILPDAAVTGGSLGGALAFRSQTLDPAEAQLGAIATSFAAQVNAQNALGLDQQNNPGGDLFAVAAPTVIANLNNTGGASLTATLTDPTSPPTGDMKLSFDGTTYTLTDASSGKVLGTSPMPLASPATIGGVALTMTGTMAAGDSFTIEPTRGALNSFKETATDPRQIAAASPAIASNGSANLGTGKATINAASAGFVISSPFTVAYDGTTGMLSGFPMGSTVTVNTTPPKSYTISATNPEVPYDAASGNTFTVNTTPPTSPNGISFTLNGTPQDKDTFTIGPNTGGTLDGSNALAMANLVSSTALGGSTLTDSYADYVNNVGNTASQVTAAGTAQGTLVSQITQQQQSVSGVNLDEEATNLVMYQQLYQANSKVIQTADSLFDTILQAIN
ncbi:flagellar hook-associated protein FlgK [Paraburkholderia jirisanensis]